MSTLIAALFADSNKAGQAIADLKDSGYTNDISVISKQYEGLEIDTSSHQIKQQISDGAIGGGAAGAIVGGIAALLSGLTAISIPGAGIFISGALAVTLLGTAAGGITGSLIGALVDAGIPDMNAKQYEDRILAGETLVTVSTSEGNEDKVASILQKHGAVDAEIGEFVI